MSRLFYHIAQDNLGNLLFDVSGTMRLAGTGTLATIYGDEGLTIPIANPMTNHPSFGSFKCFLGAGNYDFYMAKSGYTFETLTGVQGLGTMAQQDAGAVAITGGAATFTGDVVVSTANSTTVHRLVASPGATYLDRLGVGAGVVTDPSGTIRATMVRTSGGINNYFDKNAIWGLNFFQQGNDAGGGHPVAFYNTAVTSVGAITTNATTTNYSTTSDARLKRDVTALTGALAVVQALRPVAFRWRADDSPGHGFIASEVQQVVDGVITGDKDAVDEQGNIQPQQIDHSRLVPWLTAALQEAVAQVQALAARVASLEEQLGVE